MFLFYCRLRQKISIQERAQESPHLPSYQLLMFPSKITLEKYLMMSKYTACLSPVNPTSLYCLHIQVVYLPFVNIFFISLITCLPDHTHGQGKELHWCIGQHISCCADTPLTQDQHVGHWEIKKKLDKRS